MERNYGSYKECLKEVSMGSTDNYLSVMIESLEKKIAILTEIVEKNTEQNGILSSDELDTEAMQNNMDEKQSLIEQLNQLDEGFNIVFARIKQELEQNRSDYKVEIETMKQRIIQVTDLSMKIQTAEAYNKALAQKRFGIIEGVTDKNYITNSYHVHVTEKIDAFTKLKFESEFQALSPGGAISYVEVPNMMNNIDAVLSVMQYIYNNIMYAELNTKSDYCQCCGYTGEIQIVEDDDKKLVWECPNCGNRDQNTMNVARRTCGYIGTQFWNQGRTQEIKERVLHL